MQVTVITGGPKLMQCDEDEDFTSAFDKMLSENIQVLMPNDNLKEYIHNKKLSRHMHDGIWNFHQSIGIFCNVCIVLTGRFDYTLYFTLKRLGYFELGGGGGGA